jgi:hypothetical protein
MKNMGRPSEQEIIYLSKQYPGWQVGNTSSYRKMGINNDMKALLDVEDSLMATSIAYDQIGIGAASKGHIDLLSYAMSKGASNIDAFIRSAVTNDHISVLQYIYECQNDNVLPLIRNMCSSEHHPLIASWLKLIS